MAVVKIVKGKMEHAHHVGPRLRAEDVFEIEQNNGIMVDPTLALAHSAKVSNEYFTVMIDDYPEALFGVADHPKIEGVGVVWMLGTDDLPKASRELVRDTKSILNNWLGRYDLLVNFIYEENKKSLRWLKALGAEFGPKVKNTAGHYVIPFCFGARTETDS